MGQGDALFGQQLLRLVDTLQGPRDVGAVIVHRALQDHRVHVLQKLCHQLLQLRVKAQEEIPHGSALLLRNGGVVPRRRSPTLHIRHLCDLPQAAQRPLPPERLLPGGFQHLLQTQNQIGCPGPRGYGEKSVIPPFAVFGFAGGPPRPRLPPLLRRAGKDAEEHRA